MFYFSNFKCLKFAQRVNEKSEVYKKINRMLCSFYFIFSFLVIISHLYLKLGTSDLAYHGALIQFNKVLIQINVNAFFIGL